jgi:hypothetical protein
LQPFRSMVQKLPIFRRRKTQNRNLQIKTPIQKPAHLTHMKKMHKQTSRVGWVIHFFFSFLFELPDLLLGPSRAHWGPSGPLWGPPNINIFSFFLFCIFFGLVFLAPLGAHMAPRGPHGPPLGPLQAPLGPITKFSVTPPLSSPACLGLTFHLLLATIFKRFELGG